MLPSKDLVVYFLLLLIFINDARCHKIDEMSEILDEILVNIHRISRRTRDREDVSLIWQKYEFGTGVGNREDVVVTNISTHKLTNMSENNQWLVMQTGATYFISAENSTLFFYKINFNDLSIKTVMHVKTEGQILQFKILNLNIDETTSENNANNLMAVFFVKQQNDYSLYWYRIFGTTYTLYSIMPVQKQIQDLEFVREDGQYKLLLLDNDTRFNDKTLIDIYNFDVDYKDHHIDIWFCRRLFVPKILDVQVCPISERTVLAFRKVDSVVLYEAKKEDKLCQFEEFQVIKSNKLANFICFESGYIQYLAIGGQEPRLLYFSESEFQDNGETNLRFSDITWITAVPINTYRDESLLLIQLRNSTVIALAWHGSKFKAVPLPNEILNTFDLSKVVAIPNVGFIYTNTLVRIEVNLKEIAHPIYDEMESMLKTQAVLEEVFRKQETIFDETEALLNQSYLNNPNITGFWNLSEVNASNATIGRDVYYDTVKVGSLEMTIEDIKTNVTSITERIEELDAKLEKIYELINSSNTIVLPLNSKITGDFVINGTLYAKNLNATSIYKVPDLSTKSKYIVDEHECSSIDFRNLTVHFINDIPVENIVFDTTIKNYSDIEFSRLKRLKVEGHLNFSKINDITWEDLMATIVWKDKPAIISGETIIEGTLIAEDVNVENLNHLQYPSDYVLNNSSFVEITGAKYFSNLSTTHLRNIEKINGISIDDFIISSRDEVLDKEITFENLKVDGTFTIDGNVTGLNVSVESLLNETDTLLSDVSFENLIVMGNIVLENSIDEKTWSDLDDLLLKTEKRAVITGNKTFLNDITIESSFTAATINDHLFSEFVTLNTEQDFPYLEKISANITFGNVTLGSVQKLHDYVIGDYITHQHEEHSGCLNTILSFTKSVIVEDLFFKTLKQTISQTSFFKKLNNIFQSIYFDNLTISTLMADEVLPEIINGIDYAELVEHMVTSSTRQNLTGALTINNLETDILDSKLVNGMSVKELKQLLLDAQSLYNDLFNSNTSIKSLQVTGMITASSINANNILDIFDEDNMATVIFNKGVSIEDLTVKGFVNGLNFSEFISDAVLKTDRNVTFTGFKIFENVTCEVLETLLINGHSVDDILSADKEQVLKGPIVVNGSVTVLNTFNTIGKIGNVSFHDFTDRFKLLGNNSYALRGNVSFIESASIRELDVSGSIQGVTFDSFTETIISKNDTNVTISGSKLFKNLITFKGMFTIDGSLNDLDLYSFHEGAVYIDKPFSINSTVIFKEDVYIEKDLIVKQKLQSNTVKGVDMKELQDNAIALNQPTYIPARMTLDNATFQANIKVTQINDLEMDLLIPLHTKQLIMIDWLNGTNVTVKNFDTLGRINTYYLKNIFEDTFMIYDNQNITGNIRILGNVYAFHNFDAYHINGVNPKQFISLTANETLTGNFIFKSPVILRKSLRILGSLNGIKPVNWLGAAIKRTEKATQIISGKWKIHGNVHFESNVKGSEFLNGVNITETSLALAKDLPEINRVIENADEDIYKLCVFNLDWLKCNAANQIYKFNTFDYLKVLDFEGDIHDIYNIEIHDTNYILVNYDTCRVKLILYDQTDFQVVDVISDFGLIDRWMVFKSDHGLFLLTTAKRTCGRSLNNIWKLENNRLTHILELGNIADMDLSRKEVVSMIHESFEAAPDNIQSDILEAITLFENKKLNLISNNDSIVQATRSLIYEPGGKSSNDTNFTSDLDYSKILKFRVGIYQKEEYIYYNEELSPNYIYIYKNDVSQTKILQVIKARRPRSIRILHFPGFVETLLIFVENTDIIRIYEYRGIEGFVERNAIHLKVDKLFHFKIRKYTNLEKRYCLAAVYKNRLTILEARMHGEKLDLKAMESLKMDSVINSCFWNTCPVY